MNRKARSFFGYAKDELLGRRCAWSCAAVALALAPRGHISDFLMMAPFSIEEASSNPGAVQFQLSSMR